MFREMRRIKQRLSSDEIETILKESSYGVLSLLGDDGYPYAVPLNYVYSDSSIIFHSALTGHKIDAIDKYDKASFCVVAENDVIPLEYTTHYRSVIVFGRISIVEDEKEKRKYIEELAKRYAPDDIPSNRDEAIDSYWHSFSILRLRIEHSSGKKSIL